MRTGKSKDGDTWNPRVLELALGGDVVVGARTEFGISYLWMYLWTGIMTWPDWSSGSLHV